MKELNLNDVILLEGKIYKLKKRKGSNGEFNWDKIYLNLVTDEEDTNLINQLI